MKNIYFIKKSFIIIIFLLNSSFASIAYSRNLHRLRKEPEYSKFETSLRMGISNQIFGYNSPITDTDLEWNQEVVNYGFDLKYSPTENFFTMIEYNRGQLKGGKSTINDVKNGNGTYYKTTNVKGFMNDLKLNLAYKLFQPNDNVAIFFNSGGFYKNLKAITLGGYEIIDYGRGAFVNNYPNDAIFNTISSKYYGAILGTFIENKKKETKDYLQFDLLIPIVYSSNQKTYISNYGYQYSNLKNKRPGFGYRINLQRNYKIGEIEDHRLYFKIYGFYEMMKVNNLKETEYDTYNQAIITTSSGGSSKLESYGVGIGFEF
jgi:hypothetical protein